MRMLAIARPAPGQLVPAFAGSAVIVLALPLFVIAGWRIAGWALAAWLWGTVKLVQLLLTRWRSRISSLAAAGVQVFGMFFRAIGVLVVLIAVAVSDSRLALAAAVLYGLAYTVELGVSLVEYFGAKT